MFKKIQKPTKLCSLFSFKVKTWSQACGMGLSFKLHGYGWLRQAGLQCKGCLGYRVSNLDLTKHRRKEQEGGGGGLGRRGQPTLSSEFQDGWGCTQRPISEKTNQTKTGSWVLFGGCLPRRHQTLGQYPVLCGSLVYLQNLEFRFLAKTGFSGNPK